MSAATEMAGRAERRRPHRLSRYGPLILWAAFIFIGSTDLLSAANTGGVLVRPVLWLFPHASERTVAIYQFATRKTGHLTEYFIFALLCVRVFGTSSHELLRRQWFWASLLLVVVYSLGDELHQSFYPSRTASIYDCMTDSLGGYLSLAILRGRAGKAGRSPDREKYFKSGAVV